MRQGMNSLGWTGGLVLAASEAASALWAHLKLVAERCRDCHAKFRD